MNHLARAVLACLGDLENRGPVVFFAVAERGELPRWDVIFAASWADEDWAGAIRFVMDALHPHLTGEQKRLIARVAVVPTNDTRMREALTEFGDVGPQDGRMAYRDLLGSDIRRAYVFKAADVSRAVA